MADGNLGFGDPYLDQSIQDSLGDTVRAYNLVAAPQFASAQVRSGSFGNSGLAQMQQEAQRSLQTSLGRQANDMRSANYWNDANFNRNIYNDSFAQGQQRFQNGMQLLGMQNSANQQNLGFGNTIQDAPLNYYQGFANTANGMGQGFASQNSSMKASGSPLMGAMGGWQMGRAIGNSGMFGGSGNYGFSGSGTPDMSGASTNGNGAYGMFNNPSAYTP